MISTIWENVLVPILENMTILACVNSVIHLAKIAFMALIILNVQSVIMIQVITESLYYQLKAPALVFLVSLKMELALSAILVSRIVRVV
jgi:hypothetical protein